MSRTGRIDLAAPPFPGHLFPLLALGKALRKRGYAVRVLTSGAGQEAVRLMGLEGIVLLPGRDAEVAAIANPPHEVRSNPWRLMGQLEANLKLMGDLGDQLGELWSSEPPDLVLADSVLPLVGLRARERGIPWWTTVATPCSIESRRGTPSYLGGWSPGEGAGAAARDFWGRQVIHGFKRLAGAVFRRRLRELGIEGIYRRDGSEAIYSPEKILGFGIKEFEFEREWPEVMEFIGYPVESPPFAVEEPPFETGRRRILITLGTHLPWAKERALTFFEKVAARMPQCDFDFSLGQPGGEGRARRGALRVVSYLPYDEYLENYDVAVMHGGAGVTYACIGHGVPMLVWPHDYDQFDHAARIVASGLGRRLVPEVGATVRDLEYLLGDEVRCGVGAVFRERSRGLDPGTRVAELVERSLPNPVPGSTARLCGASGPE